MADEQKDRIEDDDLELDAEQAEDVKGGATLETTRDLKTTTTTSPYYKTTTTTTTTTTTSPPPPGSPTGATS